MARVEVACWKSAQAKAFAAGVGGGDALVQNGSSMKKECTARRSKDVRK
jgi:hypothetical protein